MSRFTLSPRARADIEEIWDYTESRWSSDQAETYVRQIRRLSGASIRQDLLLPADPV